MTAFEWHRPEWWKSVAPHVGRRDSLDVMGLAHSLGAAQSEDLLALIRGNDFPSDDLPDRAFGAYPLAPDDVEPFLRSAGALMPPADAAVSMTERLVALEDTLNETALALNILDVWRHCHDLTAAGSDHASHCSCLMTCSRMPRGIRTLDEALQTYYEDHLNLQAPDCFGSSDESFRLSLRPLIRRCLDDG
jgi:hypothetical protein